MKEIVAMKNCKGFILLLFIASFITSSVGASIEPRQHIDGRIVGGENTTIYRVPFQVSIERCSFFCGGALIAKRFVLTAAHCTLDSSENSTKVRIGSTHYNNGGQLVDVKRITRHDRFYGMDYDYAILELNEYNATNLTYGFAELPKSDINLKDNTTMIVSGWGNSDLYGNRSEVLRSARVPKINQLLCAKDYGHLREITPRMMCAGNAGKGLCLGDYGGPLVYNGTVYGIASWGLGCATPDYPGVYSRVAVIREWIRRISGV